RSSGRSSRKSLRWRRGRAHRGSGSYPDPRGGVSLWDFPETHRGFRDRVVAVEFAHVDRAIGARTDLVGALIGGHQVHQDGGGIPEIEPVTVPAPPEIASVTEPAPTDAGHLVLGAVGSGGVGHLAPEPDHMALFLVDDDGLVRVLPPIEPAHLEAEGDVSDLL